MTEAEWLACGDPAQMLAFLRGKVSERKLDLFACGLWRHSEHLRLSPEERATVEDAELLADGFSAVRSTGEPVAPFSILGLEGAAGQAAAERALRAYERRWSHWAAEGWEAEWAALRAPVCRLLRDIVGNPFRLFAADPAWLTWHGGLLASLARRMYDSQDFAELPVAADMLEDAGCHDEQALEHCRAGGKHVRGCWVVDALLAGTSRREEDR